MLLFRILCGRRFCRLPNMCCFTISCYYIHDNSASPRRATFQVVRKKALTVFHVFGKLLGLFPSIYLPNTLNRVNPVKPILSDTFS